MVAWCKELLGYPAAASGLLVSGTSLANLIGLAIALNSRAAPSSTTAANGVTSTYRRSRCAAWAPTMWLAGRVASVRRLPHTTTQERSPSAMSYRCYGVGCDVRRVVRIGLATTMNGTRLSS